MYENFFIFAPFYHLLTQKRFKIRLTMYVLVISDLKR